MTSYTADDIARYIVNFCIEHDCPISNLQLQKILYFCQIEYYRRTGNYLFDDDFEAWRYGPVIPTVYRLFSLFGGMKMRRPVVANRPVESAVKDVIDEVILSRARQNPWDLVDETHRPGSPWSVTYLDGAGNGRIIEKRLLFDAR